MIRLIWVPLLMLLGACQAGPPAAAGPYNDDDFVLPGDFSELTTVADLAARFGRANVTIVEPAADDPDARRSIVLFPDDPGRRAYVEFHDDQALAGLAGITVRDAGSRWRGKGGVHVGMSFADLEVANGKPFGLVGFDSRRRGWAHDQWSLARDDDDGGLGALDVKEGERMYFGVELGLRGTVEDLPTGALPFDESISSDDPRYPRLGELVEVTAFSASTSLDDEWQ